MAKVRDPWEPDPKWSKPRREAFVAFRDQPPPRSLERVAKALAKSGSLVRRWSSEDDWQDRIAAWDVHCDRIRRQEFEEGTGEAAFKQGQAAATLIELATRSGEALLKKIAKALDEERDPFEGLSPAQVVAVAESAAKVLERGQRVERLARGQTTEEHGVRGLEDKTDDQLRAYLTGRADEAKARAKDGVKA